MWVVFILCPRVLMSPSNLETPILLFRGYFLISLITPHPPYLWCLFGSCVWTLDLLKWSSDFLHFSLLFFIFFFYFLGDCLYFIFQPFSWYPPPLLLSWAVMLLRSSFILNQCSLCIACCPSFRIAILSFTSLGILIFTKFSFSVSWSHIFLFLFAIFPQIK